MANVRARGEVARKFIIENVDARPSDIIAYVAQKLQLSRQAVHKHVQRLVEEGVLSDTGKTRNKNYQLIPQIKWQKTYPLNGTVNEGEVWLEDIVQSLGQRPENVRNIWHYGFTEMFNNAIDHSEGSSIILSYNKNAANTSIALRDNGIGIFNKIQTALGLLDPRHAVLELAKGKFTTDPKNHSGEGIFFTSRMFDHFWIISGDVTFAHHFDDSKDWISENDSRVAGTYVLMEIDNHTSRTTKKIFDKFSTDDEYGFTKTIVPVELTQYGDDNLVSRSQAKRLLVRIDRFKMVVLDFAGVAEIGQAFADEIFRVFAKQHPDTEIVPLNANAAVKRMISRARSHETN